MIQLNILLLLFKETNKIMDDDKTARLCLVTVFVFYFQKLAFENIKKK